MVLLSWSLLVLCVIHVRVRAAKRDALSVFLLEPLPVDGEVRARRR
jgi:hypothetical protein